MIGVCRFEEADLYSLMLESEARGESVVLSCGSERSAGFGRSSSDLVGRSQTRVDLLEGGLGDGVSRRLDAIGGPTEIQSLDVVRIGASADSLAVIVVVAGTGASGNSFEEVRTGRSINFLDEVRMGKVVSSFDFACAVRSFGSLGSS